MKAEPWKGKVEPAKTVKGWDRWNANKQAVGKTQSEGHNEVKLAGVGTPKKK